jgi:membrane-associated phospholipid phosphatase
MLQNVIKNYAYYFTSCAIAIGASLCWIMAIGKAKSFLLLNQFHPQWLDTFFIYFTFLGDGLCTILLCLLLFFMVKKRKLSLTVFTAFITSGIAIQIVKFFVDAPRPLGFFKPGQYQFFIHDITHSANNSFPSGHATTAFAVITVIAVHAKKSYQLPLFLLAVLISYSRVYLAQHFLTDITAGAFIGVLFALISIVLVAPIKENKLFSVKK